MSSWFIDTKGSKDTEKESSSKRKRSPDSNDDESIDYAAMRARKLEETSLEDMSNRFWLMTRQFYTQTLRLCRECNEYNYKQGCKRFQINEQGEERVHITTTVCKNCALANIEMNNATFNSKR